MKKRYVCLMSAILVLVVVGCSNHSKKEMTNRSTSTVELSTSKDSSEKEVIANTEGTINESSIDDVRKENPTDTVSQLRRQLYEAGINSSTMSDSELEQYKKEADEKEMEFTKYVSDSI